MSNLLNWADKKNSALLDDFIAKHGAEYCMTAQEINEMRDAVNTMGTIQQSVSLGPAEPTDTPTGSGRNYWEVIVPGTYTNFGGVVLDANKRGLIYRDETGAFSISQVGLDLTEYAKKVDSNKKALRNTIVSTYQPVHWNNSTYVFNWDYEIQIYFNTNVLAVLPIGNAIVPQGYYLVASLNASTFEPLDEFLPPVSPVYPLVVSPGFDITQKGCVVIGKNHSTRWTSNYIQMIPKYWEVPLSIGDVTNITDNVGKESELHSKNGILNPVLPVFWSGGAFGSTIVKLDTIPEYLSAIGLEYFVKVIPTSGSTNTEEYIATTTATGLLIPKVNQWIRWSYYVYSPGLSIEPLTADRLKLLWLGGTQFSTPTAIMKKVSEGIYIVYGVAQFTGDVTGKNTLWIENIFKKVSGAAFTNTEFIYLSGFKIGYSDNKDFFLRDGLLYDYKALALNTVSIATPYNDKSFNFGRMSEFLRKYEMKEVDDFNQLSIVMVGDSIFGRQTETELALTQDMNGGVGNGYATGHFPPNMWNKNVAFKLLEMLQYPDSDVKYFNHAASEITFAGGGWVNRYPVGADATRLASTAQGGDSIALAFTGATHVKIIFSSYYGTNTGINWNMDAEVSADGGATWVTPESLGLTHSPIATPGGDGSYQTGTQVHKWGNVIWKGFNPATNYILRCSNRYSSTFAVWGFETWSKPRINVIVTAEGGNIAESQLSRWERFYSKQYNPALVIYEMPYLNDLGVGMITNYKGIAVVGSVPDGSPTVNDFWYASETGVYTNFSGITAKIGQYIEWSGAAWRIGQTTVNTRMSDYNAANDAVLSRCATLGVPVLTLITHESTSFYPSKPYTYKNGLSIIRNLVAKYGFASIDVNYYQMNNGFATSIQSDGTHLNDTGVEMYRRLLAELFAVDYSDKVVGTGFVANKKKTGTGTGAGTIAFGYEFSKVPIVRIYGNSSIVITAITQSGFTVTGSGNYDYEAFI